MTAAASSAGLAASGTTDVFELMDTHAALLERTSYLDLHATLCIAAAHFDADRRSWAEWALLYEGMDEGKLDEGLVARLCSVAKWRNERLVPLIDGSVHSTPGWPNANGCARALWAHRSARLTDDGGHLGLSS
jgi:hypothetical protein